MDSDPDWLEYFSGGVPTGEYFRMTLDDIRAISATDRKGSKGISRLQELCFIGLISYFEAFCKDHFASLINIEPSLIANLKAAGQDVSVDASHVVMYGAESERRVGFVLASKYDFGTPKKINWLFGALLKVTPFSKSEVCHFDKMLRDRHLLVHHGGTLTLKYLEDSRNWASARSNAFYNARVIQRTEVAEVLKFVETVARKLLRGSHAALVNHLAARGMTYSGERQKALDGILWWGDRTA